MTVVHAHRKFRARHNPDIDTVNVNNRVQTVISQLPQEVQLQGIKVQKKSSSILQFVNLYDESGKYDPLFITNSRSSTSLTSCRARRASGGQTVRRARLLDADLVRHGALDKPQSCSIRHQRPSKAECSGVGRPHRRTSGCRKSAESR